VLSRAQFPRAIRVSEASRILFLDALNSGASPGSLTRLTGTDLLTTTRSWSVHQLGLAFLARHATGDWGELEPTDAAENEYSIAHGFRLLSSYQTDAGEKVWIITEADRSATIM
jgi:Ni,Fe-hydrogenase maturation factor